MSRQFVLNATDEKAAAIERMMEQQDLSEDALLRLAVRHLQRIQHLSRNHGLEQGFFDATGRRVLTSGPLAEV